MGKTDEEIQVIAKLMDESDSEPSIAEKAYDQLYDILNSKVPEILDKGLYLNNSTIVRNLMEIIRYNGLFTTIPGLIKKNIILICGNHNRLNELLQTIGLQFDFFIQNNLNLPLLTLYHDSSEEYIYALTYAGKLIELSNNEFLLITKELYKKNIEIRKIIKGFVLFSDKHPSKAAFCIVPEFASIEDESFKLVQSLGKDIFIAADKNGKYPKLISKAEYIQKPIIVVPENMEVDFYHVKDYFPWENYGLITDIQFELFIQERNTFCINFLIRTELSNIFMQIIKFYTTAEEDLNRKIEFLARDSVNLTEPDIKEQVKEYRKRLIKQRDDILVCRKSIEKLDEQVTELAYKFEETLSEDLNSELGDEYNTKFYVNQLVRLYLLHVDSHMYDKAKEDVVKLLRINYKDAEKLGCYCKYIRGLEITEKEKEAIKCMPDEEWYAAKVKIAMSEVLEYTDNNLKKIVSYVSEKSTGKEWYYYGMVLCDKEQYIEAGKAFMNALDYDYTPAGNALIRLAESHPECKIDIEELAENLVSEANFFVGYNNIDKKNKYKKAVVNLKMAASREYLDAIVMVADILFDKYKHISWQHMDDEGNIRAVNNVINLYLYLCDRGDEESYRLRIGLMYLKLKDYQRALKFLKNINKPEAQYECAKMYQYGNGVAKNLKKAKSYYSKINVDYKDTKKQLNKVIEQIEREKVTYSEETDYSSSPSSSYEGSSFCFITTAACMALHSSKDCEQLNVLRRFRDEHILKEGEDGEILVKEYYRIGPILVNLIDSEWNPFTIYAELWEDFIAPSRKLISEKKWYEAKSIYIDMVINLCRQYHVPLDPYVVEKYGIII